MGSEEEKGGWRADAPYRYAEMCFGNISEDTRLKHGFAGSITYLLFPSKSHLLSASEDGTLCLFRSRDWAVLRALKGHKGPVNCVAVHPSGKVALSVGKDRTLRMWDLMRGCGSASTKLGKGTFVGRDGVDGSAKLSLLLCVACRG